MEFSSLVTLFCIQRSLQLETQQTSIMMTATCWGIRVRDLLKWPCESNDVEVWLTGMFAIGQRIYLLIYLYIWPWPCPDHYARPINASIYKSPKSHLADTSEFKTSMDSRPRLAPSINSQLNTLTITLWLHRPFSSRDNFFSTYHLQLSLCCQ